MKGLSLASLCLVLVSLISIGVRSEPNSNSNKMTCSAYESLTSQDRQMIANTRYSLEQIETSSSDSDFKQTLNLILQNSLPSFSSETMTSALQGLIAEAILRRQISKTIGLDHLTYKRFQIFADLILYHRAMDHQGFVDYSEFLKTKNLLEKAISNHFDNAGLPVYKTLVQITAVMEFKINNFETIDTRVQQLAKTYTENETQKQQVLGALEIYWNQLLSRNTINQTEVVADLAVTDLSINAAIAVTGFVGLIGYGPAVLQTAKTLWAWPLSVAVGCAFGMSHRKAADELTSSYLEMSRALYLSVKNKTSFACELGLQNTPNAESVKIPDEKPTGTKKDYLMACATTGAAMIFPKAVGLSISGLMLVSFASSSYTLVKESIQVIQEIPRLYELKQKLSNAKDQKQIDELIAQIEASKTKITLYLLAFGNTGLEAFRQGLFLYGGRENIKTIMTKAKEFLIGKENSTDPNILFMQQLLQGLS